MERLKKRFFEFQNIEFPSDSKNDELSILHAELVDYDGYVAGILESKLNGQESKFNLYYDEDLEGRIDFFLKNKASNKEEKDLAKKYLDYLLIIKSMIRSI